MRSLRNERQPGSSSQLSTEGVLRILDACYQVERAPIPWLDGILEAMERTLAWDAGVGAILYDIVSDTEFRLDAIRGRGVPSGLLQAGTDAYRDPRTWPSMVNYYRSHLCETLNEPVADPGMQTNYAGKIGGQVIINGADGSGKGCAIHVFSSRSVRLAASQQELLRRIAAHLATAYRLQQLRANAQTQPGMGPRGFDSLSGREQQVAVLATQGRSNKLIAYELGLAHSTVRVLITRACAKLGVSSRAQLVACVTTLRSRRL